MNLYLRPGDRRGTEGSVEKVPRPPTVTEKCLRRWSQRHSVLPLCPLDPVDVREESPDVLWSVEETVDSGRKGFPPSLSFSSTKSRVGGGPLTSGKIFRVSCKTLKTGRVGRNVAMGTDLVREGGQEENETCIESMRNL